MKALFIWLLSLLVWAAPLSAQQISEQDRREALLAAADLLEQRYVDAVKGAALAAALRDETPFLARQADPEAFAAAVTSWLRAQSGDGHLGLGYSLDPLAEDGGEESFSATEMERWYGAQINHGIEKVARLEGNVMLLDLRVFPPPSMGADMIVAAMTLVAQGDALIIDLRRNGGGAETAQLLMAYLVEPGAPLSGSYDRPSDTRTYRNAANWVPGRRFGSEKPLYVLTSARTFSAAEAVAYDLQALGRATIVGEVTGGGAHPFEYRRVHDHFALDLPEATSINPITGTNWQDVGVQPDIHVPAEDALDTALDLARAAIAGG